MPYDRPTLTERRDDALQDIAAAQILDSTTGSVVDATMLQTSPLRALAYMTAGAAYDEDGYIDFIALQAVPWTATGEAAVGWAALKGIYQKPATAATGAVTIVGPAATPISAGTGFTAQDGTAYSTTANAELSSAGSALVPIAAVVPGSAGNLTAGVSLTMTLTIPGVSATAVVAAGPVAGADIEQFSAFRARYLAAYAAPAQGGDASDYVNWALAIPGVTRAWANPLGAGAGSVVVYTMWDLAEAANGGFPQGTVGAAAGEARYPTATGDLLAVATALYPLRPVTALVVSAAPIAYPVAFTIVTTAAVSAATQAAVAAALVTVFTALASPKATILPISPFETAIAAVGGMPDFTLTVPAAAITAPLGHLPILGAITWAIAGG